MAVELATAYINLVPSTRDLADGVTASLVPSATTAGASAGAAAGTGMLAGIKKFLGPAVVAGAATGLYQLGSTFDDLADTIRVGTGTTGAALDGLVESAQNVGRDVPAEFGLIGPVVADLNTRLGLTGDTLETVAAQYLQAGRMLGQDVDIQATTAAFSAFGIEGADVVGAMDALFTASQATGVGMNELAGSAQKTAPALKELGFSFEDSIALVGQFDKIGLNTTQVMSGMSRGLVNLAQDGEAPQDAFRRVVGEIEAFVEVGDTAAALDLASQVFGTRGAPQFLDAIASGILSVEDLTAAIGASSDTILEVGDETADFAESWQLVKNNALLALEPLASAVFTGLADVFAAMVGPMQTVSTWLGENTWAFGVLAGLIGGALTVAFYTWAASVVASTVALLANPITWIVVGIVALVAALVWLVSNWDTVVAWIQNVWAGAVQWVKDLFASIGEWFTVKGAQIGEFLSGLWSSIRSTAEEKWNGIVGWFRGIPGMILGALGNLGGLLVDAGKAIIGGLFSGLKSAWDGVAGWFGGIGSWIAAHKGPKSYDLNLLVPAGQWIMTGLSAGLRSQLPALQRTLADVSAAIQVGTPTMGFAGIGAGHDVAAAAPGRMYQITVNNPTPEPAGRSITAAMARAAYLGMGED